MPNWSTPITAASVFLLTLYLILVRPKGLSISNGALLGAGGCWVMGLISRRDLVEVAGVIWNATFALVGIIVISQILDRVGLFRWGARHLVRLAGHRPTRLFLLICTFTTLVSIIFSNDGSVIIVTPIVFELLSALGYRRRQMLPFVLACGFIADTMSLPLVVSNLMNIITADYFGLSFLEYARVMLWPSLASFLASLAILYLVFRRTLVTLPPATDDLDPREAIIDGPTFRLGLAVITAVMVFFFAGSVLGWPVSLIILIGAAVLAVGAGRRRVVRLGDLLRSAPWEVVIFSLGMYLVVFGLRNAGLIGLLARWWEQLAEGGRASLVLGVGFSSALLSSVMNNHPSVMVGALAINSLSPAPSVQEAMVYANLVGCDLGPKLTPIGSLATLLWLHLLRQRGLAITWQEYLKAGLVLTPPVLLVVLATLGLS